MNKKVVSVLISVLVLVGLLGVLAGANNISIAGIYAERDMVELKLSDYQGTKVSILLKNEKTSDVIEYKSTSANVEISDGSEGEKVVTVQSVRPLELDTIYSVQVGSGIFSDKKYFQLRTIVSDDFESYTSSEELRENWAYFLGGAYQAESQLELVNENGSNKLYAPYKSDNTVIFPKVLFNEASIVSNNLRPVYTYTDYVIEIDGGFGVRNDGNKVEFRFVGGPNFGSFGTGYNIAAFYAGKIGSYTAQNAPIEDKGSYTLSENTIFDAKMSFRGGKVNSVLQVMDDKIDETYEFSDTVAVTNVSQCLKFKLTECTINSVYIYVTEEIAEIPESLEVVSMQVNNPYITEKVETSKNIDITFNNPVNKNSLSAITLSCAGKPVTVSYSVSTDGKTVSVRLPEYIDWEYEKEYTLSVDGVEDSTGMRTAYYEGKFKAVILLEDDFSYNNDAELNAAWKTTNPEVSLKLDKNKKAMIIPPQAIGDLYVYPKDYNSQSDWEDYYLEYEFLYTVDKGYAESGASMKYTTILSTDLLRKTGISFRGNGQLWSGGNNVSSNIVESINISNGATGASSFIGDRAISNVFYKSRISAIDSNAEVVFDRTNEAGTPNGRIYRYSGLDANLSGSIMFEGEINVDKYIRNVKVYKIEIID